MRLIDLTGHVFGRLTVIERAPNQGTYNVRWVCLCACGQRTVVPGRCLRAGESRSCGCLSREEAAQRLTRHGGKRRPEYRSWKSMRARCLTPGWSGYMKYGARGIRVSPRWDSFEQFLADVGPRPSPLHSLDRYPNREGDYEPGNVRWATQSEQQNNRSDNRFYTYKGETHTIAEWARMYGLNPSTLWFRLNKNYNIGEALTAPVRNRKGHAKQLETIQEAQKQK